MPTKPKVGVIHGRFQPVHLGHMEYLLAGKRRCDFLYVGISMPDPRSVPEESDPRGRHSDANPFTYFERLAMIRKAMTAAGVPVEEFEIVPFPLDRPEYLKYYVPLDALFFVTVYNDWGEKKARLFQSMGLEVDVMGKRKMSDRLPSGTEIRRMILEKKRWDHLAPPEVYDYIVENGLDAKITHSGSVQADG